MLSTLTIAREAPLGPVRPEHPYRLKTRIADTAKLERVRKPRDTLPVVFDAPLRQDYLVSAWRRRTVVADSINSALTELTLERRRGPVVVGTSRRVEVHRQVELGRPLATVRVLNHERLCLFASHTY